MKISKLLNVCFASSIILFLVNNVYAVDLSDLTGAVETLQAGQAATAAVPSATTGNGLTGLLVQQLGVTQPQAEGGAGAIFQFAKSNMEGQAFQELSKSVPVMQGLLAAAPVANSVGGSSLGGMAGKLESLAGNSGGAIGNVVGLANSFQQLGLSPSMVQKFVPLVVQYVQGTGGNAVAGVLQSALTGVK